MNLSLNACNTCGRPYAEFAESHEHCEDCYICRACSRRFCLNVLDPPPGCLCASCFTQEEEDDR